MTASKTILGIGYIFSFFTVLFLFTIVGVFIAILTYPLSIILRTIGWIGIGGFLGENRYKITGLSDILFGALFFTSTLGNEMFSGLTGLPPEYALFLGIVFWAIYSLIEWISYLTFFKKGFKIFIGSMISIIGIILTLVLSGNVILSPNGDAGGLLALIYIVRVSTIFLMISSIVTAIAFFKVDMEEMIG